MVLCSFLCELLPQHKLLMNHDDKNCCGILDDLAVFFITAGALWKTQDADMKLLQYVHVWEGPGGWEGGILNTREKTRPCC